MVKLVCMPKDNLAVKLRLLRTSETFRVSETCREIMSTVDELQLHRATRKVVDDVRHRSLIFTSQSTSVA